MPHVAVTLGHICLEVGNLARSRRFWGPLLAATGFQKLMEGPEYAGFTNGAFELFLCRSKPRRVVRKPPTGKEMVVADHFALRVRRPADVDTIAAALTEAGIKPLFPAEEHRDFAPGYYAASYRDPDQNVVEVFTMPKPKKQRQPAGAAHR